jgi:hypothetical protein
LKVSECCHELLVESMVVLISRFIDEIKIPADQPWAETTGSDATQLSLEFQLSLIEVRAVDYH